MSAELCYFHPINPERRLVQRLISLLKSNKVIIIPTECSFVFAALPTSAERLRHIRSLDKRHHLSILVNHIDSLGSYVNMNNAQYRSLKRLWPGPYTIILKATKSLPKSIVHEKKKTIGVRISSHPLVQMILEILDMPLTITSVVSHDEDYPITDLEILCDAYKNKVDAIVMMPSGVGYSTVIDWSEDDPVIIREGLGPIDKL